MTKNNMDELLNALWVEKYRPKNLDELVIDSDVKKRIKSFEEDGEIPHLLLVGTAGIGKTSLAKILVNDVLDCEYLNINASDEGGIDMVRNEVKSFASSATFDGKPKVIILGEADGLTSAAQNSLKEIIEDYAESTRFIFTANDISKISFDLIINIRSNCRISFFRNPLCCCVRNLPSIRSSSRQR